MDFDLRIEDGFDCGKIEVEGVNFDDFIFNKPKKNLLDQIEKRGLLNKCFSLVISDGWRDTLGFFHSEERGLFHIVAFRNKSKKELILEKICEIEDLEEWKIDR